MELIFFFIIIVTLAIYGLGKWSVSKTDYVRCVEAGPTTHVSPSKIHSLCRHEKQIVVLGKDGKAIDTKHYQRVVVKGNCLKPLGIEDEDQLLVSQFNNDGDERKSIKKGDILMIYLKSKDIYKVRVFDDFLDGGLIKTHRYNDNGDVIYSSRPHELSSVEGVVKYVI